LYDGKIPVDNAPETNVIQGAINSKKKLILAPNQFNILYNHNAQGMGTEHFVELKRSGQLDLMPRGLPTVLHLGGNDLIDRYRDLHHQEATYRLYFDFLYFFKDPMHAIRRIYTGERNPWVDVWWLWGLHAQAERSAQNMKEIVSYLLYDRNAKLMLVMSPMPVGICDTAKIPWDCITDDYAALLIRLFLVFKDYNVMLAAQCGAAYGQAALDKRFVIQDLFTPALMDPWNYISPDLMHLSGEGLKRWGVLIAYQMADQGWAAWNPEAFNGGIAAERLINEKAKAFGVPLEGIYESSLLPVNGGYKKEFLYAPGFPWGFTTLSVYLKDGNATAFGIWGVIRDAFVAERETGGFYGFPVSDMLCECAFCLCKRACFENGSLFTNHLDFITPIYPGGKCW
jgi:hypothetical protein